MDATIERIGAYAQAIGFEALPQKAVHETKRRIIDSLGCALGGYDDEPCRIARAIAARVKSDSGARILGTTHRTLPELATFANGVMTRYLDGNDTLPGGGGHPSDTIPPMLAVADATGSGGKALIAAIALAYEIYYAFFRGAIMRERGLDHVLYTAVASAVGRASCSDSTRAGSSRRCRLRSRRTSRCTRLAAGICRCGKASPPETRHATASSRRCSQPTA